MKEVNKMKNVYKRNDVEEMLDNDEISAEEAAFMLGYAS